MTRAEIEQYDALCNKFIDLENKARMDKAFLISHGFAVEAEAKELQVNAYTQCYVLLKTYFKDISRKEFDEEEE